MLSSGDSPNSLWVVGDNANSRVARLKSQVPMPASSRPCWSRVSSKEPVGGIWFGTGDTVSKRHFTLILPRRQAVRMATLHGSLSGLFARLFAEMLFEFVLHPVP